MTMIAKARPRALELGDDLQKWLRSVIPWQRRRSRAPRVLGALALVGLGVVAALYMAPIDGRELRARTRKGAQRLSRRARELAERAGQRAGERYRERMQEPGKEREAAQPGERERTRRSEMFSS